MPLKTTDVYTTTAAKKKGSGRKRKSALSLKQQIAVKAIAKSAVAKAPEVKYKELPLTNSTMVNAGVITHLTALSNGTDSVSRLGNEVKPAFLSIRYRVVGNTSGANTDQAFRIMLIQWRTPSGITGPPVMSDLFHDMTDPYSYAERAYTRQYRVLYNQVGVVSANTANPDHLFQDRISLPGKVMKSIDFDDASSTNVENGLWLIAFSNEVTNSPRMLWTGRFGYTDA